MTIEIENKIGIHDAMTYDVITAHTTATITEIAKVMSNNNISAVVIENNGKIEGIVTSNDIISKVVSKNIAPNDITADMVMSNYIKINMDTSLNEASSLMMRNNKKLLLVMEEEQLKGIITSTDIVNVSPGLIELFVEKESITENSEYDISKSSEEELDDGICEVCGVYSSLSESDGQYLCSECIEEEKAE